MMAGQIARSFSFCPAPTRIHFFFSRLFLALFTDTFQRRAVLLRRIRIHVHHGMLRFLLFSFLPISLFFFQHRVSRFFSIRHASLVSAAPVPITAVCLFRTARSIFFHVFCPASVSGSSLAHNRRAAHAFGFIEACFARGMYLLFRLEGSFQRGRGVGD